MRIALDAMGGDYAPDEIVKGALEALKSDSELDLILTGNEAVLTRLFPEIPKTERLRLKHCTQVIEMDEHPAIAYRKKKDASITVATQLVKDGQADAVVSAGSTGAQMTAALLGLGRIPGIERPAIVTLLPTERGRTLLLDSGANTGSGPEALVQFAQMGQVCAKVLLERESPTVCLLSNGSEETKGDEAVKAAHQLLKNRAGMNFQGNVEGRDLLKGRADVIVCDGFAGNVALKVMEGTVETVFRQLKGLLTGSIKNKIGAWLIKNALRDTVKNLDYSEHGGAPLLGVDGISVICHGSSNATAIKNALFMAKRCVKAGFLEQLRNMSLNES
ncbi:MAG: phosphate acyltransferase PlsX [Peptococcaceae bacterium]|jgi:glycerol-3-phosphate acyltransferase PlsX|nr:phosphate acyltransferase PlsX [Peptococcaceae bacterium]